MLCDLQGYGAFGGLGTGTTDDQHSPVPMQNVPSGTVTQIESKGQTTYLLLSTGDVYGMGYNADSVSFDCVIVCSHVEKQDLLLSAVHIGAKPRGREGKSHDSSFLRGKTLSSSSYSTLASAFTLSLEIVILCQVLKARILSQEIGDGSTADQLYPTLVTVLPVAVTRLYAGYYHCCKCLVIGTFVSPLEHAP